MASHFGYLACHTGQDCFTTQWPEGEALDPAQVKEDRLAKTFPVPKSTGHLLDPLNAGVDRLLAHHFPI
jgi:hypothetical protein